jgi:hypothetical protein
VATHVKVIAGIFVLVGAMWAVITVVGPAILATLAGVASTSGDPDAVVGATVLGFAGVAVTVFAGTLAVAFLLTAWGLFKLKPWARIVAIIMAAVCLTQIPFGTAFGIYALIILFKKDTESLFAGTVAPVST